MLKRVPKLRRRDVLSEFLSCRPVPPWIAPDYVESLRFMVDAKIHWAQRCLGPFLQPHAGAGSQAWSSHQETALHKAAEPGRMDPFYPVSSLIAYRFGAGANSFGDLADASVIAARVDHSVAANLNVHASFLMRRESPTGMVGDSSASAYASCWFWPSPVSGPPTFFAVTGETHFLRIFCDTRQRSRLGNRCWSELATPGSLIVDFLYRTGGRESGSTMRV